LQPWRTGMPRGGGRLRCAMSSSWSSAPRASGAAHHVCRRGEPLQVARPFGGWKSGVCPGAPVAASRSRNALAGTRPRSSRTSGCRFRALPLPLYRAPGRCAPQAVNTVICSMFFDLNSVPSRIPESALFGRCPAALGQRSWQPPGAAPPLSRCSRNAPPSLLVAPAKPGPRRLSDTSQL
jgi:hypothetical protein